MRGCFINLLGCRAESISQYWRYAELVLRYQDTIVGQLFGVSFRNSAHTLDLTRFKHMNIDHVRVAFLQISTA